MLITPVGVGSESILVWAAMLCQALRHFKVAVYDLRAPLVSLALLQTVRLLAKATLSLVSQGFALSALGRIDHIGPGGAPGCYSSDLWRSMPHQCSLFGPGSIYCKC